MAEISSISCRRAVVIRRMMAIILTVVGTGLVTTVSLEPRSTRDDTMSVAVIYPPWRDQGANILSVADVGAVVGVGVMPFVIFARTTNSRQHAALRQGGAWLVVDAAALRWCDPQTGDFTT